MNRIHRIFLKFTKRKQAYIQLATFYMCFYTVNYLVGCSFW